MNNTNPFVKSAIGMTIMDISALCNVLHLLLGFKYGYLIQKLEDVGVISFILTLCNETKGKKRRKLRNVDVSLVEIAIQAWGLGRGFAKLEVTWDYKQ